MICVPIPALRGYMNQSKAATASSTGRWASSVQDGRGAGSQSGRAGRPGELTLRYHHTNLSRPQPVVLSRTRRRA